MDKTLFTQYINELGEIGYIEEVLSSIVYVSGLSSAKPYEVVLFESGQIGQIVTLEKTHAEVLVFSTDLLRVGTRVARTNEMLKIPVDPSMLGHTINPLGFPISQQKAPFVATSTVSVHNQAPGIETRALIKEPLETGVVLVDLMVPLGKGQRELIIGDRKTGKTHFILHTLLTQARQNTICIYAAIGKKTIDIKKVEEFLTKNNILQKTIIVATNSQEATGLIFLTPYTGMAIAEYFRDQGQNVLVILDDLTTHAKFFREQSLLAKRFPGRNSYPGDIFYTHSRLLERAGNFATATGAVSITCLPVVETIEGDLTGYIQTNIMSMTDGHIYFDTDYFSKGRRPAVNPFLSVTRVGNQTQTSVRREINRELTSFLTLYEKLQAFVHFGTELNDTVKHTLATGNSILAFFDQPLYQILPMNLQVFLFSLIWVGVWQTKSVEEMKKDMDKIISKYMSDKGTKGAIDSMVSSAKSWNKLLGTIKQESGNLF